MIQPGVAVPSDRVRAGFRLAMNIGIAEAGVDRPTFVMPDTTTSTGVPVDDDGVPFDAAAPVTVTPGQRIQVPCSFEEIDRAAVSSEFGQIIPTVWEITILDEDYAQVRGFRYVLIGGEPASLERERLQYSLGDVAVHQLRVVTLDDKA